MLLLVAAASEVCAVARLLLPTTAADTPMQGLVLLRATEFPDAPHIRLHDRQLVRPHPGLCLRCHLHHEPSMKVPGGAWIAVSSFLYSAWPLARSVADFGENLSGSLHAYRQVLQDFGDALAAACLVERQPPLLLRRPPPRRETVGKLKR